MRGVVAAIITVVVFVPTAFAQLSPEEAQARLAERRARAATRPASDEVAELRSIVAQLRAENVELKALVANLRSELKARPIIASAHAAKPDAAKLAIDPNTALRIGMTLADAEAALGTKLTPQGSNPNGSIYHCQVQGGTENVAIQYNVPANAPRGYPRGNTVETPWFWDVTALVADGKVANFRVFKDTRLIDETRINGH